MPARSGFWRSSNGERVDGGKPRSTQSRQTRSAQYGNPAPLRFPLALVVAHRGDLDRARELGGLTASSRTRKALTSAGLRPSRASSSTGTETRCGAAWFAKGEAAADAAGWVEPNLRWWRADYAEALIALGRTDEAWRC